jgi:uncharacterized protein
VGKKDDNKGIVIAYSKKVRKVAIVTGTGLDNILPPSYCRQIIDERMLPMFRKGDYYNAILEAVGNIKNRILSK